MAKVKCNVHHSKKGRKTKEVEKKLKRKTFKNHKSIVTKTAKKKK